MVRSTIQRMGSMTKPFARSLRLTISITKPGMTLAIPSWKIGPGIGAAGKQLPEERELSEQGGHQQDATVTVLNVSGSHQCVQQQPQRVDEDVALLAFDQFARIKSMRIDARPPFLALFTLWLSTIQAVGLASRSACSRHFTYSA